MKSDKTGQINSYDNLELFKFIKDNSAVSS
jgi:hypothetical protein